MITKVKKHFKNPKYHKPWAKAIREGILIVVGFFILVSVGLGDKSTPTKSAGDVKGAAMSSQPQKQTGVIGQTIKSNNLEFTVTNLSITHTLTGKNAQGMYYVVSVTVKNESTESKRIDPSNVSIADNQGIIYQALSDQILEGGTNLFSQQLIPTKTVSGSIVFDIPKGTTGLKFVVQGDIVTSPVSIDL